MKAQIDKFFSDHYDFLIDVTNKKISYFKRDICPASVISNAYLYIIEKSNIKEEKDIPIWTINYINTELSLFNSQTIRKESIKVGDNKSPDISSNVDLFTEVSNKILLEGFVNNLDRLEQIIWEVLMSKGMLSSSELADHFKLDRTSAWIYKKNIITKFKEYVNPEGTI